MLKWFARPSRYRMYLASPDEAVDLSDPASIAAKCYSDESMEFKTLDQVQSYYFPGYLKPVIAGPGVIYEIDGQRWKRVAGSDLRLHFEESI